jgi:D-amino-acid dehydrogenase
MNIAIVGAGIVGVTTAYELARDGHTVTVLEQRGAAAEEASFASTGILAPALLRPWAAPGACGPLPVSVHGHSALSSLASSSGRADQRWLRQWRRRARNISLPTLTALAQLARYSQQQLNTTATTLQAAPEMRSGGLVALRSESMAETLEPILQLLRDAGLPAQLLSVAEARQREPGLGEHAPLAAAIHLPEAQVGNCRLFAHMLRQAAQELGVQFAFGAQVQRLHTAPVGLQIAGQPSPQPFDAVVLCAGAAARELLQPLGFTPPLATLHGYTVSAPLREDAIGPQGVTTDLQQQISITRLGQRIRVGGGAELGNAHQNVHHAPTLERLYRTLNDWFPGTASMSAGVQIWRGSRCMSADGLPLVGASGQPGLWLNLGHGDSGWSLASGCARILADQMAQRSPALDATPLACQRF